MKAIFTIALTLGLFLSGGGEALQAQGPALYATPPAVDYHALPPFVIENAPLPNVLIILDNSNSMDENTAGEPVGSFHPQSRSEIARRAIRTIIEDHGYDMRIGLMTFRQEEDLDASHLHSMFVHTSYDRGAYDPGGAVTPYYAGSNTRRFHNPSYVDEDPPYGEEDHYIYYDKAVAYYMPTRSPDVFCYSTNFRSQPVDPIPGGSAACSDKWFNAHICGDNPYYCHTGKLGFNDIEPDGEYVELTDQPAIDEHAGQASILSLGLTDSDVAKGVYQVGAQMAIMYVGGAWLSTDSPGGGEVVVEVDDPGPAHKTALLSRIARGEQFQEPYNMAQTAPMLPVRNAGLTPLYSTLESAQDYFAGKQDRFNPQSRYAEPIVAPCQKNFIVLVTDGLPTEDPQANGDTITPVVDAVGALRSVTAAVAGAPYDFDIQTFVLGFALPRSAEGALDPAAVAGGTDINGGAYYAGDEDQLAAALRRLFGEIKKRTASAASASVISAPRTGVGAVYQAVFHPLMTDGVHEVDWTGDVRGLFMDAEGYMHESTPENGGQFLQISDNPDDPNADAYVTMCYDDINETVRIHKAVNRSGMLSQDQVRRCSSSDFPEKLTDVEWLWSGGEWLAELADAAAQRIYDSADSERYIITAIDTTAGDDRVDADEEQPFLAGSFSSDTAGLLQTSDAAAAEAVVNYIRGVDQAGMRSRQIDYDNDGEVETWRLGDIVYAGPVVVQRPAEDLDLLYGDASYKDFAKMYAHRRQMVYVGANDGMLHAFNGGWYDPVNKAFLKGRQGQTQYDLGAEVWAYVPYNLLPHLRHITDPAYSCRDGRHLYFVDLQPVVFDAKIFGEGGIVGQTGVDHTGGWGTLLVGGMRLGGREVSVEANPASRGSDVRTMRSSFFIIDVTDPEKPPKLLLEFTHPNLGYTTSRPTPLKVGADWYLMLGSGPYPVDGDTSATAGSTQNGRLFLIDLKSMALENLFGTGGMLTLSTPNSFVSDLVGVDFDLGDGAYATDGVYFGTVSGPAGGAWSGDLQRVRMRQQERPWSFYPVEQWQTALLLQTGKPMAAAPSIGMDTSGNRWVFAGSGRYFTSDDSDDSALQFFYGIKEPSSTDGRGRRSFSWDEVSLGDLQDVTAVEIYSNDDESRREFDALRGDMTESAAGWFLALADSRERTSGQAALLGDILSFSTYIPGSAICDHEGSSNFYAVYFATGSAYFEAIVGVENDDLEDGGREKQKVLRKVPLGAGMTSAPNLFSGKGDITKAILQASTGEVIVIEQSCPGLMKSGPIHWELWTPDP